MPQASVNDITLHYRIDGDAGAPALVFANSLGADHTMWDAQARAFAPHYRVVRYDARGHGQSTLAPGPYTVEQLGRDVVALLDHLQIERAVFCGLSLGGATGQWLGIHAPRRLERLVLANTAAKIGTPDQWNQRIAKVHEAGVAGIADAVMSRWFTAPFMQRAPDETARMRAMMLAQPTAGYVAQCAAVRDMDLRGSVARIDVPTLVVAGTHDASTTPADAAFLASAIRGARYVELGAAHISNVEAPAAFDAAVLSFLRDTMP